MATETAQHDAPSIGTEIHKLEVFVGGALVYATREPVTVFDGNPIRDPEDASPHFASIQAMPQEVFAVMSLNGANEPIKTRWVTVGLLDCNQVHPREVFADPLMDRAASIIVAHNHPSGTLEPSPEDLAITKRLQRAGELLGIKVLDHLIVTATGLISLKQKGHM